MSLVCFMGSYEEPLSGEALYLQETQACTQFFLGFVELPNGDEHSPGDVDQIGSISLFLGFWVDSDRGKRYY